MYSDKKASYTYIAVLYIFYMYASVYIIDIVARDIHMYKTRGTAVIFLNQRKVAAITGLWCP